MTNWFSQVAAVTGTAVRTIPQRRGSSLATVVGIAGVVAVMVAVLSIGEGFRKALRTAGSPDNALVLRAGSDSEMMSVLLGDAVEIIAQAPGVARGPVDGAAADAPLASGELFVVVDLPKRSTGTPANVPLRGVQPAAFSTRENLRIVEGRKFEWGRNELLVGEGAARQFRGLEVGSQLVWGRNEWTVVGIFSAGGALWDSELWTDARVLQPAYQRGNSFQTLIARLESPAAFDRFKDALTTDPRLDVQVLRETEYYGNQGRTLRAIIEKLGFGLAVLMGVGAIFGAVNTMYSAVAARTREIATLRALGFGSGAVVVSVLMEALLLAAAGGTLGAIGAWLFFDGYRTSTLNWDTFSQVTFAFDVTGALMIQGAIFAILLGLLGGLFPALRAARLPVTAALREA
ncbi:MAG: FtsX-like permease family protein [Thermoanaerobaculia bacterium]|nr:MAG: FtsX-like permease family protein [Thermoanaerobaculia bacterium]MBZ0102084.1 ABC transporter permease [Thermoanaerobaculia bacterium]